MAMAMAMVNASMTVRAWLRWPVLVGLGAALVLVTLQSTLGAGEPQQFWNFEGEDARDGWTPVELGTTNAVLSLAQGEGVGDSQGLKLTIDTLQDHATASARISASITAGASYELGGHSNEWSGDISRTRLSLVYFDADANFIRAETNLPRVSAGEFLPWTFTTLCNAEQAELRIQADGADGASALFDDIYLKESPPDRPCPTPVPSPTQTSSATLTATPSPSPTPTDAATPTDEPTSTSAPSHTPIATDVPSTATPVQQATATATEQATTQPPTSTQPSLPATATAEPPTPVQPSLEFSNGGFEQGTDGEPDAWQTFGGLLMQSGTPARSGSWSGALFSSTDSTKWAFQTVSVEPADWYEFQAFVYQDGPWVESALLRISWYASDDGSGSAVASVDSTDALVAGSAGFRPLSTGPVMAPPGVHSAKVRILMRPIDETSAAIYIDDVSFEESVAPVPPTEVIPVATSTTSPTAEPTSTVPATAQPTATPTNTSRPTGTPRPADTATPVPAAATSTSTSTPEPTPIATTLTNGGFESALDSVLDGWQTFGGLLLQVDSPVRSGTAAGGFFSSSSSTKWIYQTVGIEPTAWYQFDAFVHHNHVFVDEALLRISWYASTDGSGSALVSIDSTASLASVASGYRSLTTGPTQAPPGARSAKLRILMRLLDDRSALIYIDDVSFTRVAAPAVVEATPTQASESTSPHTSQVLSSFEPAAASVDDQPPATTDQLLSRAPMPVPVIRRHTLQTPDQLATPVEGDALWPWVLLGASAGAGAVGWAAYWALRRRKSTLH
jgi:hypothetical protein